MTEICKVKQKYT